MALHVKLNNKWNRIISKGTHIAKEGLGFVNKQIEDIRSTLNENSKEKDIDDIDVSSSSVVEDTLSCINEKNFKFQVFYVLQSPCNFKTPYCLDSNRFADNDFSNMFFIFDDIVQGDSVQLTHIKQSFPAHLAKLVELNQLFFRFKFYVDDCSQPEFVWLDLCSDQDIVPCYEQKIYMKLLFLSKTASVSSKTSTLTLNEVQYTKNLFPAKTDLNKDKVFAEKNNSFVERSSRAQTYLINDLLLSAGGTTVTRALKQNDTPQRLTEFHMLNRKETNKIESQLYVDEEIQNTINKWALKDDGSLKDARTLLCSLHNVLWTGHQWEPVTMANLIVLNQDQLKKMHRSAILLSHPDKHHSSDIETQYRAHRIFQVLNESFKTLKNSY